MRTKYPMVVRRWYWVGAILDASGPRPTDYDCLVAAHIRAPLASAHAIPLLGVSFFADCRNI